MKIRPPWLVPLWLAWICMGLPVEASDEVEKFIAWWADHPLEASKFKGSRHSLTALPNVKVDTKVPPEVLASGPRRIYVVHTTETRNIVLSVPTREVKFGSVEDFDATYPKCKDNKSWLAALPSNKWTPVDLNPHCSESYGVDETELNVYWLETQELPLIAITTNGPACVPAYLYAWSKAKQMYQLVKETCGG